ncbi:MAG TPA: helix-turn-helix domain-containing protein [Bacteroidia bacterium]
MEDEAFYQLIKQVVDRIKEETSPNEHEWLDGDEAMKILNIKTSALQTLRNEGKIEYSQPSRKVILYKRSSLFDYLNKYSKKPF